MKWTLAAAGAVLLALPAAAEVTATAQASATEVTVGERFTVDVRLTGPAGAVWTCPERAGDDRVALRAAPEAPPATCRYVASVFALGDAAVPPIEVGYRLPDGEGGTVTTSAVPVTVTSLLDGGAAADRLDDVRKPVKLPLPAWFWIAVGTLAAVLAGGFWTLLRRRRRPAEAGPEPVVSPDEEALAALDRLAASDLLERGELKRYYVRLTATAKVYLGRRLEAPVPEMTSAETATFLREHPVGRDHLATVRELTGAADLVKFARGSAAAEDARRQLEAVRALVAAVEDRLRALAAAEATSAAEEKREAVA